MGQFCSRQFQPDDLQVHEVDYLMPSYSSKADMFFSKIESHYCLLKHFQLIEFLLILTNYCKENSKGNIEIEGHDQIPSKFDKSYYQGFPQELFHSFLENKILRHFLIYTLVGEDQDLSSTFKEVLLEIYSTLLKKLKRPSLQKIHIIAIALLYCHSPNRTKVKFLFNLFVDEKDLFSKSAELIEFLFSLFLIPSYCMLQARQVVGKRNDKLGAIKEEEKFELLDPLEVKDCLRLRDIFLKDFFLDKDELTFAEFQDNFEKKEFLWIFDPHGVRANLEKSNDVQPVD